MKNKVEKLRYDRFYTVWGIITNVNQQSNEPQTPEGAFQEKVER